MNKPVWRLNTGKGVPSDFGDKIIYFDGEIYPLGGANCRYFIDGAWGIESDPSEFDIYAYQTNRTNPAKYR